MAKFIFRNRRNATILTSTTNRYDKYKDSGIEWIGEIPDSWNNVRLRFLCNIQTGNKDTVDKNEYGEYPFYVRSPIIERIDTYSFDGEAILTAGDGVGAGKVFHYVNGKFDYHQRVYNLHNFNKICAKFLFYYLKENFYKEIEQSNAKSTVDSIRLPMLLDFPIVFAKDLKEQEAIAGYLDRKCGAIDETIEKQKSVIEKLKEYKQSIITQAVTKGLDKSAPMKDSGIEWIGQIPQHWDSIKLKYKFRIKKDIAGEEGFDILSVTQQGLRIKDISTNEGQLAMDYSKYQIVKPSDFVMNHMDLLTGWVDCSAYFGVTSPDYRVFVNTDQKNCNNQYYNYVFQICYKNKIFYGLGQGVSGLGRWRLQSDKFLNFRIPIPPYNEQEQIVQYINKKCSEIDKTIEDKEKLIEKLLEYKKSLIYECVTGKRKVVA